MSRLRELYRQLRAMKWVSPGSFLLCAVTFAAVFAVLHLAGLRGRTSIFCGTLPAKYGDQVITGFLAVLYTLFYMATVIAAPILALAAAVFHLLLRHQARAMGTKGQAKQDHP